jgi:hypothetical protein
VNALPPQPEHNDKPDVDVGPRKPWLSGARAQDLAVAVAALGGAAVGYWAVKSGRVLGTEAVVLVAMGGAAAGLLAVTLAAMTIVLGFLERFFGKLIDKIGLSRFFQPFRRLAQVSGAAALASFAGAMDSTAGSKDSRAIVFGLATGLVVWAILASVLLVSKLSNYAQMARRLEKLDGRPS